MKHTSFAFACCAVISLGTSLARTAEASVSLNSNLIINGGAEAEPGVDTDLEVQRPSGWGDFTGNFTSVIYGGAGGFPDSSSPGPDPLERGQSFFAGGPSLAGQPSNDSSSASQSIIDLSPFLTDINAGLISYSLSGFFGGFEEQGDFATLTAEFFSDSAMTTLLGSAAVGSVTAVDRGLVTGLLDRGATGQLPTSTVAIRFTLLMTRDTSLGTYNDGYADNLSFELSRVDGVVPEASSILTWAGLLAGVGLIYKRRSVAS